VYKHATSHKRTDFYNLEREERIEKIGCVLAVQFLCFMVYDNFLRPGKKLCDRDQCQRLYVFPFAIRRVSKQVSTELRIGLKDCDPGVDRGANDPRRISAQREKMR